MRAGSDKQRGAVAIEFAICLIFILLPVLAGVVDFGRYLQLCHVFSRATREAAVMASRHMDASAAATAFISASSADVDGVTWTLAATSPTPISGLPMTVTITAGLGGYPYFPFLGVIPASASFQAVARME